MDVSLELGAALENSRHEEKKNSFLFHVCKKYLASGAPSFLDGGKTEHPSPRRYFTQRHRPKIDPRGDDFAIFYCEPHGVSDAVARGHHLRMPLRRQNRELATPGGEKPPTHVTINLRRRWDFRSRPKNTPSLNK